MPDAPTTAPGDWQAWLAENGPRLRLIARHWSRSDADADDILQEAFVRYWKHQRHLPGDPNALIVTSIRRAAMDLGRQTDRRGRREQVVANDIETVALFELPDDGRHAALAAAVTQLPEEQREVVVLHQWGDLTFAQVGEQLGISANTAASRWRYALTNLKKLLASTLHD
ncbi:MAG: RNA polymerase sigma factor [Opitutales bacterium]|jgi:RNA polymerase sigma-70 factor (ECF subfamily)